MLLSDNYSIILFESAKLVGGSLEDARQTSERTAPGGHG